MKHWENKFATYVYNHCNIPINFCNIDIKYLQHTSETPEKHFKNVCNMLFQCKHLLAALQMEVHRCVKITGVLVGGVELGSGAQRACVGAARAAMHTESGWVTRGGHR